MPKHLDLYRQSYIAAPLIHSGMLNEVFQHLDDSAPVTESQLAERCGLRQDFLNDVLTILAQLA